MKKAFFLSLITMLPTLLLAQERYEWNSIREVRFYLLPGNGVFDVNEFEELKKQSKEIGFNKNVWRKMLSAKSTASRDVSYEPGRYAVVVVFDNGDVIPFQVFLKQRSLFDIRADHFNYINISRPMWALFDKTLKRAVDCSANPDCNFVRGHE